MTNTDALFNHSASGWVKARKCSVQTCVEVLRTPTQVQIRDSKQLGAQSDCDIIDVTPAQWEVFLTAVQATPAAASAATLSWTTRPDGWVDLSDGKGTVLSYDADEWSVFVTGVREGDFSLALSTV